MTAAVRANGLSREFGAIRALHEVTFEIERREFVAVEGPSGSGKSTLLHLIAGLEEPTAGRVEVDGHELNALSDRELAHFRRTSVGMIFQLYDLLPTINTWQNVAIPALLSGQRLARLEEPARALLNDVGLSDRATHRPAELSGGEQQRVAIARALMNSPAVILADEPTGALDSVTGDEILAVLRRLADNGQTVIMVTHEPRAASVADRSIRLLDGAIATPRQAA